MQLPKETAQNEKERRLESWGKQGAKEDETEGKRVGIRARMKEGQRRGGGEQRRAKITGAWLNRKARGADRLEWQSLSDDDNDEDDTTPVVVTVKSRTVKETGVCA